MPTTETARPVASCLWIVHLHLHNGSWVYICQELLHSSLPFLSLHKWQQQVQLKRTPSTDMFGWSVLTVECWTNYDRSFCHSPNPDSWHLWYVFPLLPLSFLVFFLWNLPLGGSEDYRQNPAESHQSTEGELQFCAHVAALAPWFPCDCLSHYSLLGSWCCLCALWTQDVPVYIM